MRLIVCLDDRNGMSFGGRRQSRDSAVCEKIVSLTQGSVLRMNAYSAVMFTALNAAVCVEESFLRNAGDCDYCFVENVSVLDYMDSVEELIVFRWNRHYPSDNKFPFALPNDMWKMVNSSDFKGTSHDKITMGVYRR